MVRVKKEKHLRFKSVPFLVLALGIIVVAGLMAIGFFRFFLFVLPWLVVLEILGVLGFLFAFKIFHSLPDRGWGIVKFFSLLLLTYVSWLCASLKVLPFSQGILVLMVILMGGVGAFLFWQRKSLRTELLSFIKSNKNYLIITEIIFFFIFMLFVNIRSYCPEITFQIPRHAAEKFLNFEVLNSLFRTKYFPPQDVWLSGFSLNYYYFGHLLWTTLGKLSGYPAESAFNLGLATIFVLSFIGGFSLGYNVTRKLSIAFLVGFSVAIFGNPQGALDFFNGLRFGVKLDYIFNAAYFWNASRVINGTITEFPAFTALLGDLHAHHSGLLTIILGLTALLNLFLWQSRIIDAEKKIKVEDINYLRLSVSGLLRFLWRLIVRWKDYIVASVLLGWIAGSAYVINSWDIITVSMLFALAILFKIRQEYKAPIWHWLLFAGGFIILFAGLSRVFFLPFTMNFRQPLPLEVNPHILPWKWQIIKFPLAWLQRQNRTYFTDYFVHFGFFLLPIYLWLFYRLKDLFKQKKEWRYFLIALLFMLIVISINYFKRALPGFLFFIMLGAVIIFFKENLKKPEIKWLMLLLIIATFVSIFCEFLYFDDRYSGELERYNTPFKLYNPLWIIYSVLAGWCWWQLSSFNIKRSTLNVLFVVVIGLSMIYPIGGTIERTHRFFMRLKLEDHPHERTLDGMAYLGELPGFKDDYRVIKWAKENIKGQPVVLEAAMQFPPGGPYSPYSRFSTNTGLPTVLGWGHHLAQQRGDEIYGDKFGEMMNIGTREKVVREIYGAVDLKSVMPLLRKYQVKYIFVGALERKDFPPSRLEKFASLPRVYSYGNSVLYEVRE